MNELKEILSNLEYSLPKDIILNLEKVIRDWAKGKVPEEAYYETFIYNPNWKEWSKKNAHAGWDKCREQTLKNLEEAT